MISRRSLIASAIAVGVAPSDAMAQLFRGSMRRRRGSSGCNCIMCRILRGELAGYDWVNGRAVKVGEKSTTLTKYEPPFYADSPISAPTPQTAVHGMLQMVKPEPQHVLVDMGCADGRILITANRRFKCRAVGYEIKGELCELARQNAIANDASIRVINGDMYRVDLSRVDIVTAYLEDDLLADLVPQFRSMKPGSKLVTYAHPIPGMNGKMYKLDWRDQYYEFWLYENKVSDGVLQWPA